MPVSAEDQARLPPMISHEDVAERQRLEDLKEFRKYLGKTGTVKCLVKMYKHAVKEEMRLDNPKLVKEFLAGYMDGNPDQEEIDMLERENATLVEYNDTLAAQAEELQNQIERTQRMISAGKIWKFMTPTAEASTEEADAETQSQLSLDELFKKIVGSEVEPTSNKNLLNYFRPTAYRGNKAKKHMVSKEAWCAMVADWPMPDEVVSFVKEEMLPRFESVAPGEGAFQNQLREEIVASGLLPHDTNLLTDAVKLDPRLLAFLGVIPEACS
eukprot:TRINITY_DN50035_c0_g1_i1.p1 TRINITY_DN50035_c0_g1~~TRINITY_DN50035_c0_g1_i1.p1  ORF type:complete len:270 (-),score=68.04 TRINITY_DN50035_c0_g1_i1:104-913(-)